MKDSVYVLGSVNYDLMISSDRMPVQGETISGYGYFEAIGGKGANQAAACAKLGCNTHLIGCIGDDYHGQCALEGLNKIGIQTEHVEKSKSEHTGKAIIIKTGNDNRIIINQGANGCISKQQIEMALKNAEGDFFLTQFETPLELVYEGLQCAKKLNMTTVVNPAPAKEIDMKFYELIDYLVLNQSETEILTGFFPNDQKDCEKAAKILFDRGVKHVVFTLGSSGSIYMDQETKLEIAPFHVEAVDTTGAGDTYIGTMLYGLTQNWSIEKVLTSASAAGALACTKEGAQEALPTYKELVSFLEEGGYHG